MGDGSLIYGMSWTMQGLTFTHDLYVLELEPYDMVIGVDWMAAHSPITFEFNQLKFVFDKEGKQVLLHGEKYQTEVKMRRCESYSRVKKKCNPACLYS